MAKSRRAPRGSVTLPLHDFRRRRRLIAREHAVLLSGGSQALATSYLFPASAHIAGLGRVTRCFGPVNRTHPGSPAGFSTTLAEPLASTEAEIAVAEASDGIAVAE